MITVNDTECLVKSAGTDYSFKVTGSGHLEHLYYGESSERTHRDFPWRDAFPGNCISYDDKFPELFLENFPLEMSSRGKGDIREPFIEVVHADGSRTSDFVFSRTELSSEKPEYETLPGSYREEGQQEDGPWHLTVFLEDRSYPLTLELHYYTYDDCGTICRSSRLINRGSDNVRVLRLLSTQLDLPGNEYVFTSFHGGWAREMERHGTCVNCGKFSVSSAAGASSNRTNPFVMLSRPETTESSGDCWGFNLIYSGNHYEALEVNSFGNSRFVSGINPDSFEFLLGPGESLEAPEAVMTFSGEGFSGVSRNMHRFVREHIVRGKWKKKERPVLLNSWEAFYFDFDEEKLLGLAAAGKAAGAELFVMDDGWFDGRIDDRRALGDWTPDSRKLPGGLEEICRRVKALGLDFGIWIEPESVNRESRLYREHPEWSIEIPGKPHSEGRNQRLLDFANPEAAEYMTRRMEELLSSAEISYVKYDVNRILSDIYSQYLPPERQGETAHRYILGVYRMLRYLTGRFPEVLFEGCAAGGGRFDLGMLCYFPQIWASDNTDPVCRKEIQRGYSAGYPMSAVTAHVSASPNHQTGRETTLAERYEAASEGILGYELDLSSLPPEEFEEIRLQIAEYKKIRKKIVCPEE
ncbi:MAG: alpha-galactosidase [Lachnospiraceae bacterium]|nr:alpha-galactosidase [Lachnospiraceae bacterium]